MGSKAVTSTVVISRHDNVSFDPNSESIKGKLSLRAYSDITSKCYSKNAIKVKTWFKEISDKPFTLPFPVFL